MRWFLFALSLFVLVALGAGSGASAFEEDWSKAPAKVYHPGEQIPADEGKWLVGDTISTDPELCGDSPHTAEVIAPGGGAGGKALRLTSVPVDGDCADNVWVVQNGIRIPIAEGSKISFVEDGSLIDPFGASGTCYQLVPPCGDTVSLLLTDNRGNHLVYILQREASREETDWAYGPYREIQLDPAAGSYERDVFADFSTIPDFVVSGAEIMSVEFKIQEWGSATIDELVIGDAGSPKPGEGAKCAAAQMKAAGGLLKGDLACFSKFAKDPAKDPGGASLAECQETAGEKLLSAWEKATTDPACVFQDSGDQVASSLSDPLVGLNEQVVTGWDAKNGTDRSLRSALLKGLGTYASAAVGAYGKDVKKSDPAALQEALAKARDTFLAGAGKAISAAQKKGVVYSGASPPVLADGSSAIVSAFVAKTAP